jgi:hypothetical protein
MSALHPIAEIIATLTKVAEVPDAELELPQGSGFWALGCARAPE